jgi:hypothetical protein
MKPASKFASALALASVMALAVAAPASADPWNGSDIDFGLGEWAFYSSDFNIDDVYLRTPPADYHYTDIWDGMGYTYFTSSGSGINTAAYCLSDSDVDVTVDGPTGDLLVSCTAADASFATAGLTVQSVFRIFAASDVIRLTHTIANSSATDVLMDQVEFYTDFGSTGSIWGYQGQDDAVLPVPAAEDVTSTAALVGAGAQWAVHYNDNDAPGGLAWGLAGASAAASLSYIDGDEYSVTVAPFTIPAGQSRTVAYFATWNPSVLNDLAYTNSAGSGQSDAADALVASMVEFNSFSGRLTAGLAGQNVVNWGIVAGAAAPAPAAAPALAATGTNDVTGVVGLAGLLLALGAVVLAVASRRRATAH